MGGVFEKDLVHARAFLSDGVFVRPSREKRAVRIVDHDAGRCRSRGLFRGTCWRFGAVRERDVPRLAVKALFVGDCRLTTTSLRDAFRLGGWSPGTARF